MNTGVPTGFDFAERKDLLKLLPFTVWRTSVLLFGTFLPVHLLFSRFLKSKDPAIPDAYTAPFPSSLYKAGAARWPLLVPAGCGGWRPLPPRVSRGGACRQHT